MGLQARWQCQFQRELSAIDINFSYYINNVHSLGGCSLTGQVTLSNIKWPDNLQRLRQVISHNCPALDSKHSSVTVRWEEEKNRRYNFATNETCDRRFYTGTRSISTELLDELQMYIYRMLIAHVPPRLFNGHFLRLGDTSTYVRFKRGLPVHLCAVCPIQALTRVPDTFREISKSP